MAERNLEILAKRWGQKNAVIIAVGSKGLYALEAVFHLFAPIFLPIPMPPSYTDPDELFDIVNERDEVVGQLARKEVHRRGLRHRAVHVLIYNAKGEVFLQKRSRHKDTFPQRWDSSAAGHLNPGEAYDACAPREVQEELGFALPIGPQRILRIEACEETGQEFVWVYRCTAEGPFDLNPDEIETGAWFSPEEVTDWIRKKPEEFAPSLVCIWRRLYPDR